jgi:hypothetical protein
MPRDQIKVLIAKKYPQDAAAHLRDTANALESGVSPFDIWGNIKGAVKSGFEKIKKGASQQEIESGTGSIFPSAPMDIVGGAAQIAAAPITAASKLYGGVVSEATGGIIPPDQAELSLAGLGPRAGAPVPGGVGPAQSLASMRQTTAEGGLMAAKAADKTVTGLIAKDKGLPGQIPQGKEAIATLADQGGENMQGTLERIAQTPGAARVGVKDFLTNRQKGQLTRITSDLKELTGTNKTSLAATEDQIAARNTAATPLYQKAYDEGDRALTSEELIRLTGAPEVQDAMSAAVRGWQRSQIANGYGAMNPARISDRVVENTAVSQDGKGNILEMAKGRVPVFPNLQFWDYTKNALDDMISAEIKDDGTITKKGRDLTIIAQKMRSELDKLVPTYQQAREAWAGPSSYINHIRIGRGITKMSAEEFAATIAKATDADKEALRIGAVSEIARKLGSASAKLPDATRALMSPEMRGKISALMPNAQAAAKWGQRLDFESRSSDMVRRSLGGSQTFGRLAEKEASQIDLDELVTDMIGGTTVKKIFSGSVMKGYSAVRNRLMSKRDEELAKRLIGKPSALQGGQ